MFGLYTYIYGCNVLFNDANIRVLMYVIIKWPPLIPSIKYVICNFNHLQKATNLSCYIALTPDGRYVHSEAITV